MNNCGQLSPFPDKNGETQKIIRFVSLMEIKSQHRTRRRFFERQKEQILVDFRIEIQKHEFQADSGRSIQELTGIIESQRRELDHTLVGDEQLRRDQLLLQEQLSEQNRDFREWSS